MKMWQEMREFAAKQNLDRDSFLAATQPIEDAEVGMEEMSRVYEEKGKKSFICRRSEF